MIVGRCHLLAVGRRQVTNFGQWVVGGNYTAFLAAVLNCQCETLLSLLFLLQWTINTGNICLGVTMRNGISYSPILWHTAWAINFHWPNLSFFNPDSTRLLLEKNSNHSVCYIAKKSPCHFTQDQGLRSLCLYCLGNFHLRYLATYLSTSISRSSILKYFIFKNLDWKMLPWFWIVRL